MNDRECFWWMVACLVWWPLEVAARSARERWVLLTERARMALEGQGSDFGTLPKNLRKSLATAQRRALGGTRFRWHDQRHYALTRAADAGVLPHHLRGMAGWVGDESGRYVHPEAEGMRAFVEKVDSQCAPVVQEGVPTERNPEHGRDTKKE